MKRILSTLALLAIAALVAACPAPATNGPANTVANTNTNTAKPASAAPTAEALFDMEKKANEAYSKADSKHFDAMLSDKAVMAMGPDRMGKATVVQMIGTIKCEGVEVKLSEPQMSKIDNDTYAMTYKNESTGKCNEGKDGAMVDLKTTRASTIWVRSGDKWQAAWHSEVPIMTPRATGAKDEKAATAPKTDAKPAEPKKDEKAPAANANTAAAPPAPAKLTPSANTEALTKSHNAGWEAFKNKDAKYFDANITSTFAFVDPIGGYTGNKADAIKMWTETMKCEGVTKTSFGEAFAAALSPTVEILFGKGTADGTCNGRPNGDLWQTAVYVKEGDVWKLAYMLEELPPKK